MPSLGTCLNGKRHFQCDVCGGIFTANNTEAARDAEFAERHGGEQVGDFDTETICTPCHDDVMVRMTERYGPPPWTEAHCRSIDAALKD